MFCPNCGTQNDDSASACQKCAFNLKGAAAPKFKGTMLMVNAPPLGGLAPRPGGAPGQPSGASASARPPAAAPRPAPAGAGGKPLMKATMIGVAPPSPGGIAPPAPPGGQSPSRPPPPPPASTRPVQPKLAGSAPTAPAFAMPPQVPAPAPVPVPFQAAPQPNPEPPRVAEVRGPEGVNPLGGTMVAAPSPSPQSPAAPGGFQPYTPYTPSPAGVPTPGPEASSFGATTPSGFAPGEFPQPNTPPAGGGWGQNAAAQPQQAPAWGQNAVGQPQAGAIAPYAPYGPPGVAQGQMSAPGAGYGAPGILPHGPIGKMREPVMVLVLSFVTCGIFGIIALWSMLEELKRFRQKNDINPILFFLPVIQLLEMIKLPAKVLEAKRMAGVPNAQEPNVILYLVLGIYMLPADLNEIWQVASAKQGGYGQLPPAGS